MNTQPPEHPQFGVNYDVGWIGFVSHDSFVARGIRWFTRHWRRQTPGVSHVFVVIGENQCIEANGDGVEIESLDEYFLASDYTTYLRQPIGWTPALGARIAAEALKYKGLPYDYDLILADAVSYSLLGRLVNGLTRDSLDAVLTSLTDSEGAMICDKLAAVAIQAQPELRPRLTLPARQNNPQRLFGDDQLFAPDVTVIQGGPANIGPAARAANSNPDLIAKMKCIPPIIFAQGIDNVPASFLKNALMCALALAVGAGGWAAWAGYCERRRRDSAPRESREPRGAGNRVPNVRKDMCDFKMGDVSRRLDDHARQIGELWEEMRAEDQKTRERLDASFQSIQRSLGKIEGKLEEITDR